MKGKVDEASVVPDIEAGPRSSSKEQLIEGINISDSNMYEFCLVDLTRCFSLKEICIAYREGSVLNIHRRKNKPGGVRKRTKSLDSVDE